MARGPRDSETTPDWTISRIPNGSSTFSSASSLPRSPVASMVSDSGDTSITLPRNRFTASMTWLRDPASARTLISASSRDTEVWSSCSMILITLMSLLSCLVICSSGVLSAETTIVIRDMSFCSVAPTASDSMLNPRRENNAATRASTPGLSLTSTDNVCVFGDPVICAAPPALFGSHCPVYRRRRASGVSFGLVVEERADAAGSLNLVVAGSGGNHRPHLRVRADDKVDHHRPVVDRPGLVDHVDDVFFTLATQSDAAQRLGQLDEVGDAVRVGRKVGLRIPLLIKQRLPLPHHAQVAIVDQRHLDRRAFDRAGGQFLVGHLEAAIAVDCPHFRIRASDLGAHGRRDGKTHGAQPTGIQPSARVLVFDELRRPHLVLSDAGDIDRVRAGDLAELLDHVFRAQAAVALRTVAQRVGGLHAVQIRPPVGQVEVAGYLVVSQHLDEIGDDGLDVADD